MLPIFLVVGAPAVGKSTTSKALAAHFPKSIHIPVDNLRDMVVSGLVLPSPEWGEDLVQQLTLARQTAVHMALKYQQAGFVAIIDDFWDPHHLSDYQPLFQQPYTHKVVLYPSQHEAHQRNLQRSGTSPVRGYLDEGIRLVYSHLTPVVSRIKQDGWVVIDTTSLSVEATISHILQTLEPEAEKTSVDLLEVVSY